MWEPIPFVRPDMIVGLDLGQSQDFTGLIITDRTRPDTQTPFDYGVRAIERLPLGTPYPAQVVRVHAVVKSITDQRPKPTVALVADYTGVGRPVADMLQDAALDDLGCRLELVTITGGDAVMRGVSGEHRVPKRDLASSVLVLLQSGRLKIAKDLDLAAVLTRELTGFRVKISLSGHDSYGAGEDWRSAPHDDLVLALALACWYGETIAVSSWTEDDLRDFAGFLRVSGVG